MSKLTAEQKLREALGSELSPLLITAEGLAQNLGIFSKRRENEGFRTLKAALKLAIAVWEIEKNRSE